MPRYDDLPEPKREQWDVDSLWARVRVRTVDAADDPQRESRPCAVAPTVWQRTRPYVTAASIVIATGATLLLLRAREVTPDRKAAQRVYQTSSGQFATIRLADSGEVILAPESKLTIAPDYTNGDRMIALDGEAIFQVHHDAAHPLRVMARDAVIDDIGTRFDVRAYPFDDAVTVAVVEGAASISDSHNVAAGGMATPLVLRSGDIGRVDHHGVVSRDATASANSYLSWATGTLSFRNRPLPEVLRELSHWYGIEVRVLDPRLARRTVTADFARDSSSATIDALALTLNATVERTARVITLKPR
jgi:transmembrane sensor